MNKVAEQRSMLESLYNHKKIHFIGIGGISMSSIAALLARSGKTVSGSDRSESAITQELANEGIKISIGQKKENITDCDLIVYTAAVSEENPELREARERGIKCVTRAEALGALMLGWKSRIGIAGTHGKSTTTAMIGSIFGSADKAPTIVNGACDAVTGEAYNIGGMDSFIFEACEYTDSFLSFFPTTAVVTNVEFDHADYFHSTEQYIDSFAKYIALAEKAVVNLDSANSRAIIKGYKGQIFTCSSKDEGTDFFTANITLDRGFATFDIFHNGERLTNVTLSVPGLHNVSDALTAAAAAYINGIEAGAIKFGLESYRGIKRRMEFKGELEGGARLFDDYAHHPTEIKASLAAAKAMGGRVICVFQPHSLSRTAELFDDFVKAFDDADILIITDIYENLELDTGSHSVTSRDLADKITGAEYIKDFADIIEKIKKIARIGDDVIIMGAGSIGRLCEMIK